jgi:hypothetical protein
MYRIARTSSYLIPLLVLYVLPVFAAQEPKDVAPAEALKARVVSYYTSLQKGQKATALDLVAPESKNEFFNLNNEGLVDFRVLDVQPSDAGERATVRIQRTDSFAGFPQVLKRETVDTWKRIDGQWYVVLPVHNENGVMNTPLGKMYLSAPGQNKQQTTPQAPLPQKQVSPEEAKQALQKAILEANKKKSSDRDKKPEDKKSEDQAAPKQNPPN